MPTFPNLTRKGGKRGYSETPNKDAAKIASKASGLPSVNKLFTFDGPTWKYTLSLVADADKITLMTFYNTYKEVPFDWLNPQDGNTYEVVFAKPPACKIKGSDGTDVYWDIQLAVTQYSPL